MQLSGHKTGPSSIATTSSAALISTTLRANSTPQNGAKLSRRAGYSLASLPLPPACPKSAGGLQWTLAAKNRRKPHKTAANGTNNGTKSRRLVVQTKPQPMGSVQVADQMPIREQHGYSQGSQRKQPD